MSRIFSTSSIASHVQWVPASHGRIPVGAVPRGLDKHGELVYVARAVHKNNTYVGNVASHLGNCRIMVAGKQVPVAQYEVLTLNEAAFYEELVALTRTMSPAQVEEMLSTLAQVDQNRIPTTSCSNVSIGGYENSVVNIQA